MPFEKLRAEGGRGYGIKYFFVIFVRVVLLVLLSVGIDDESNSGVILPSESERNIVDCHVPIRPVREVRDIVTE